MSVTFKRPELEEMEDIYRLIKDVLAGEDAIKAQGYTYLPKINSGDNSDENTLRNRAYHERAVFYSATERTVKGLIGEIFTKAPEIEVPEGLNETVEDVSGAKVSLIQASKKAAEYALAYGRLGLFVDYPSSNSNDVLAGKAAPSINTYEPWRILNWRCEKRGSQNVYSLIVLQESWIREVDEFEVAIETQYRVLRLGKSLSNDLPGMSDDPDVFTVEVWRESEGDTVIFESYQPTGADGKNLTRIPFVFIGSENNDSEVDNPPIYPLAKMNIHHYMNSADYEETVFQTGQPTLYFSGLDKRWVDEVLKGKITLGSRAAIPLPPKATAGILQINPNTLPMEGMNHKEKQMAALGAKMVELSLVEKTATEVSIESSSDKSILVSVADNVSDGYKRALEYCTIYTGEDNSNIKFKLNTNFRITNLTPDARRNLVEHWMSGAISFTEMRRGLRDSGLELDTDTSAKSEIDKETEKKAQVELSFINKQETTPVGNEGSK